MSGRVIGYIRGTTHASVDEQRSRVGPVDVDFVDGPGPNERRARQAMLDGVIRGDTLRIMAMDRLADSVHELGALVGELSRRGVGIEFLSEGVSIRPSLEVGRSRLSAEPFESALPASDGDPNPGFALSDAQVQVVRKLAVSGVSAGAIARQMNCSTTEVGDAVAGRGTYSSGE